MSDQSITPPRRTDLRRRGFLLTVGTAGAVTAAAALKPLAEPIPELPSAAAEASQGYRDTQHVRDYYRTAKI